MAMNITEIKFGSGRAATGSMFYQYDYGQILRFPDLDLPEAYEVHFAGDGDAQTITMIGDADGVLVPDQLLQSPGHLKVYIYLHEGEDDGETEYKALIPVIGRPEPSDQEPTPVQQDAITQAIAALNAAVSESSQSASDAEQSAREAAQSAQDAAESAASIDTSVLATKAELANAKNELESSIDDVETSVTQLGNNTVHLNVQTLTDAQKRQALANLDAASNAALNSMSGSFNASLGAVANRVTEEITRATQAESDIRSSIPTSAQISALAPVQSVNGMTGAVTISTATTSADGLMSSQDKSRLDALYSDYSSALTALGV